MEYDDVLCSPTWYPLFLFPFFSLFISFSFTFVYPTHLVVEMKQTSATKEDAGVDDLLEEFDEKAKISSQIEDEDEDRLVDESKEKE